MDKTPSVLTSHFRTPIYAETISLASKGQCTGLWCKSGSAHMTKGAKMNNEIIISCCGCPSRSHIPPIYAIATQKGYQLDEVMVLNCSALDEQSSFADYITTLKHVTGPDITIQSMSPCKSDICATLYGVGNADISGIGVVVGYLMELLLGTYLATCVLIFRDKYSGGARLARSVRDAFNVYADAAILLNFSIQLAAMVDLAKKDYGISADNFGDLVAETAWSAALITMLPMLLILACTLGREPELERPELRLCLILVSWLLFFFTFIAKMISTFTRGQVGSSSASVITGTQAANIQQLCFDGPSSLSAKETIAFQVFAIGGSLFCSIFIIAVFICQIIARQQPDWWHSWSNNTFGHFLGSRIAKGFLILNVFCWSVPQVWALLRYRSMQEALADSLGQSDDDNVWSFGQIVAIVVFLPVLIEFGYVYFGRDGAEEESGSTIERGGKT